ncbi:MAG TPA: cupredoxin domain-containing protein [Candidatus Saccharimonadales bacterium]|nr:cupredoxin domain-containing protein [Candidatus Saccharimonadales bacterium]
MHKKVVISLVTLVVIVAAVVGIVMAKNNASKDTTAVSTDSSMDMPAKSSTSTDDSSKSTATNSVAIKDFAFSPADITVRVGTTVTWTNQDSAAHTVTETDGKTGPDSGTLATGKSYSFTYAAAGTYSYHCDFHSSMVGTVTVTE